MNRWRFLWLWLSTRVTLRSLLVAASIFGIAMLVGDAWWALLGLGEPTLFELLGVGVAALVAYVWAKLAERWR